ncbi:MAG: TlyA family RNA methyltransferase [Actinomycetaceae bacterium]|nr:TlyA family RNA methyltransferase [Actinomycetaceae bacterium]
MGKLIRLDTELVRRGMAPSRTQAANLIANQRVFVDGILADKPARQVDKAQAIVLKEADDQLDYVSRGAHKLEGALRYLEDNGHEVPHIEGAVCLDAGASTGGFTDVLLRRGAARVFAVDVGYGQLDWRLQSDERVVNIERTNVRTLDPDLIQPKADVVVGDLSFISLRLVLPALVNAAHKQASFLLMVKPQFEVGKEKVGKGGVVREPREHLASMMSVAEKAMDLGLRVDAVAPSPLPGPAGNVEYFLSMRAKGTLPLTLYGEALESACKAAILAGPASVELKGTNVT